MNKKLIEEAIEKVRECEITATDLITLLKQAIAPEPRFYLRQHVLVSNDGNRWYCAILKKIDTNLFHKYFAPAEATNVRQWKFCKPAHYAVSLPDWLPVTERTEEFTDGYYVHISKDKTMYCIIPEPEYLEVSDYLER